MFFFWNIQTNVFTKFQHIRRDSISTEIYRISICLILKVLKQVLLSFSLSEGQESWAGYIKLLNTCITTKILNYTKHACCKSPFVPTGMSGITIFPTSQQTFHFRYICHKPNKIWLNTYPTRLIFCPFAKKVIKNCECKEQHQNDLEMWGSKSHFVLYTYPILLMFLPFTLSFAVFEISLLKIPSSLFHSATAVFRLFPILSTHIH